MTTQNRFLNSTPVLSCESKNGGFARNDRRKAGCAQDAPAPNYGRSLFGTGQAGFIKAEC